MDSTQRQARVAGLIYLRVALCAPLGLLIVPAKLTVPGDATATADGIRASGPVLRMGIASELVHQVLAVYLVPAQVMRCGLIPRPLGAMPMVAGKGYLCSSFKTLVLPQFAAAVSQGAGPLQFFALPVILWLLIRGAGPVMPGRA